MSSPMKILLLDDALEMSQDQDRLLQMIGEWVKDKTIEPHLVCRTGSALADCVEALHVPVHRFSSFNVFNPFVAMGIKKLARDAQGIVSQKTNVALASWLMKHNPHISHTLLHWADQAELSSKEKTYYCKADAIVCATKELATRLEAQLQGKPVHTVDLALPNDTCIRKKARNDGRFVFINISQLQEGRGHTQLFEAMALLQDMEDLPPWEVRVVGTGPLFEQLLKRAQELGVAHRLACLGQQNHKEQLSLADALVAPDTVSISTNLILKEAWCSGVPVIASSVGVFAELLHNKDNGLLVAADNPVTLAAAMLRCIQDSNLRDQLVTNGFTALQQYTTPHMAQQLFSIIKSAQKDQAVSTNEQA